MTRVVTPWVTRRKPGSHQKYQVVSTSDHNAGLVIAGEFNNLEMAQEFALEANAMWYKAKTARKQTTASV